MKIENPNPTPLSPEESAHLEKLKAVVEDALKDGKFSTYEMDRIKSLIWEDGKVSYEELRTIHETIESIMGELPPGLEWRPH